MNSKIIKEISNNLNISEKQIEVVLTLLKQGNTIPFIARYRKEATGALDEEVLRSINEVYEYQVNLLRRKEDVIRLIGEKGLLTEEIKNNILNCEKLVEVDDIYRPYKEKRKTKATEAIAKGLEPLSKIILEFNNRDIRQVAEKFVNDKVSSVDEAIEGAKYIIAESVSDNAEYRKFIRENIYKYGSIVTKAKSRVTDIDPAKIYEMYYEFSEPVKQIKPHRVLAINRGEKERILMVGIDVDKTPIINYLSKKVIKNKNTIEATIVLEALEDSFKRLILPSVEREIRGQLKSNSEDVAIDNFSKNLENLLLTPPMKGKVILGYDPAFRTGCKLAVLDQTGKPLKIDVIYPTAPHNDIENSKKKVLELIDKYNIDVVAIGNGTASRESEAFICECLKEAKKKVEYVIVNEAGASVYSASKLAINEFPDLSVEKRSAISIGRRLQDSLAELVKIDPKSIGVGLYQHDLAQKKLDESLGFVVTKVVNQVGVNVNTASPSLLEYVSGMTKRAIEAIITERDLRGRFNSREEIKKINGITSKVYQQSIGFMRIPDGINPLDKTSIHPESYKATKKLLEKLGKKESDIGSEELSILLKDIDVEKMSLELEIDKYTLKDILLDLEKPGRDLRDSLPKPLLKSDVLNIDDLTVGMKLQGTVRNVVDFGAFIDIGLHDDALVHISKIADRYVKHPSEIVSVGDIVDCFVIDVNRERGKVSLSLVESKI